MIPYQIYLLDLGSSLLDSVRFNAADDTSAIETVSAYVSQAANLELWAGGRLVLRTNAFAVKPAREPRSGVFASAAFA